MSCMRSLNYDEKHPTCVSCRKQGAASCQTRKAVKVTKTIGVYSTGNKIVTDAYLYSLNHWHGKSRYVYAGEVRKWKSVFQGCWVLWGRQKEGVKMLLEVRRFVAHSGHIILDEDNTIGALKPVKDALVRIGILLDDTREHVEFTITQEIDPKAPRVEISLSAVERNGGERKALPGRSNEPA